MSQAKRIGWYVGGERAACQQHIDWLKQLGWSVTVFEQRRIDVAAMAEARLSTLLIHLPSNFSRSWGQVRAVLDSPHLQSAHFAITHDHPDEKLVPGWATYWGARDVLPLSLDPMRWAERLSSLAQAQSVETQRWAKAPALATEQAVKLWAPVHITHLSARGVVLEASSRHEVGEVIELRQSGWQQMFASDRLSFVVEDVQTHSIESRQQRVRLQARLLGNTPPQNSQGVDTHGQQHKDLLQSWSGWWQSKQSSDLRLRSRAYVVVQHVSERQQVVEECTQAGMAVQVGIRRHHLQQELAQFRPDLVVVDAGLIYGQGSASVLKSLLRGLLRPTHVLVLGRASRTLAEHAKERGHRVVFLQEAQRTRKAVFAQITIMQKDSVQQTGRGDRTGETKGRSGKPKGRAGESKGLVSMNMGEPSAYAEIGLAGTLRSLHPRHLILQTVSPLLKPHVVRLSLESPLRPGLSCLREEWLKLWPNSSGHYSDTLSESCTDSRSENRSEARRVEASFCHPRQALDHAVSRTMFEQLEETLTAMTSQPQVLHSQVPRSEKLHSGGPRPQQGREFLEADDQGKLGKLDTVDKLETTHQPVEKKAPDVRSWDTLRQAFEIRMKARPTVTSSADEPISEPISEPFGEPFGKPLQDAEASEASSLDSTLSDSNALDSNLLDAAKTFVEPERAALRRRSWFYSTLAVLATLSFVGALAWGYWVTEAQRQDALQMSLELDKEIERARQGLERFDQLNQPADQMFGKN